MITSLPTERISAISQWQTFLRVLPTRWRRKPAGIEITSLSPYVYKFVCMYMCTVGFSLIVALFVSLRDHWQTGCFTQNVVAHFWPLFLLPVI